MTCFLFHLPWNLLPCFCLLYILMHSSHCVENIFFSLTETPGGLRGLEESALKPLQCRKRGKYKVLIFGTIAHLASCVSSLSFAGLILNISPTACFLFHNFISHNSSFFVSVYFPSGCSAHCVPSVLYL